MSEKKEMHVEYMGNNIYALWDTSGEVHPLREVVKCKDCKYRDNDYCKEHHDHIDREEFCSRGERKDG